VVGVSVVLEVLRVLEVVVSCFFEPPPFADAVLVVVVFGFAACEFFGVVFFAVVVFGADACGVFGADACTFFGPEFD
jgi:hypothetical protein